MALKENKLDMRLARVVGEDFPGEVIFEQKPKGSERVSHETIWGKRIPGKGKIFTA